MRSEYVKKHFVCFALHLFISFLTGAVCSQSVYAQDTCARIISLAPSITETLHSLGIVKNIVGRTTYDTYPPEVKDIPTIGGFLDPSIETIVSLKPSVIIGLAEHKDLLLTLEKLKLSTHQVEHRSVEGILKSFASLGALCGVAHKASIEADHIRAELNRIKALSGNVPKKRVVIVVSRSYESPSLKDVYLSGKDGFYNSLLSYAGGVNVFQNMTGTMTGTSLEGLLLLDPDVIIEVLPPHEITRYTRPVLMAPWQKLKLLRAVREEKVFLLDDDWATIPGPRLTKLLRAIFELLHQQAP